ncbi:hypothetical protein [Kitasatospora purpeofusca]|uniref:hypothetical protein n=1 Tax=Kitasatospora purpeofusca TaxID=67352 RepID=UPI002252AA42|nr:hypothetical protein [Kitasatospora purpeofusca]MCX4755113.1 hypothetical protein [Kitasatospora purpeofusca]WSR36992.1 hypothetical protein OG715_42175 [Kitasatospora purpeofusca]
MNDHPYLLARARALRTFPVPADHAELAQLRCAVDDVERRLADVVTADEARELMLAFASDVEPANGCLDDSDVRRPASAFRLVTLAACIRHCWPDRSQPLYPGQAARQDDIITTLVPLHDTLAAREGIAALGRASHFLAAVRFLRACGYLAPDEGDGTIRLGPMAALWSERDIAELRSGYDVLPGPGPGKE